MSKSKAAEARRRGQNLMGSASVALGKWTEKEAKNVWNRWESFVAAESEEDQKSAEIELNKAVRKALGCTWDQLLDAEEGALRKALEAEEIRDSDDLFRIVNRTFGGDAEPEKPGETGPEKDRDVPEEESEGGAEMTENDRELTVERVAKWVKEQIEEGKRFDADGAGLFSSIQLPFPNARGLYFALRPDHLRDEEAETGWRDASPEDIAEVLLRYYEDEADRKKLAYLVFGPEKPDLKADKKKVLEQISVAKAALYRSVDDLVGSLDGDAKKALGDDHEGLKALSKLVESFRKSTFFEEMENIVETVFSLKAEAEKKDGKSGSNSDAA